MKLKEVLDKTISFFKEKGFDSPRLDAELLIAGALKVERIQLYLKFDQPLAENEIQNCREFVKRRSQGESVAAILGNKDFFGNNFVVSAHTLVPRPETESLVEKAVDWLKNSQRKNIKAIDLGTGTGCIGISIAKKLPEAQVLLCEKSPEAAEVAHINIKKNNVEQQVKLICLDLDQPSSLEDIKKCGFESVDLLLSNPPYIALEDQNVDVGVKKFEPHMALFSPDSGEYHFKNWLRTYSSLMKPGAFFIFEMGSSQTEALLSFAESLNIFSELRVEKDLFQMDRFICGVKNG